MKLRQPKVMHMQPVAPIPKVKACVTPSRGSRWPNMGEVRKTTSSKTPNTSPYSVDEAPWRTKYGKNTVLRRCKKIPQMRTSDTRAVILENVGVPVIIIMKVKSTFSLARVRIKYIPYILTSSHYITLLLFESGSMWYQVCFQCMHRVRILRYRK